MNQHVDVFELCSTYFESRKQVELSLRDYLTLCRDTPTTFANAAERMIAAIGEPEVIDTSIDPRLGRIFMNRSIKRYPTFSDFYGMEETIERIVGFFKHAAQGRHPVTPWGQPTRGYKTHNDKRTDAMIVSRRAK